MLPIDNYDEIKYYINLAISNNLGYRELANRIKSKEYSRLTLDVREKLCKTEQLKANDLVPNPILIKNKNNIEIISEKILHGLILENIEYFMRQLGNGYSFIGSEYKIKLGDRYNYID